MAVRSKSKPNWNEKYYSFHNAYGDTEVTIYSESDLDSNFANDDLVDIWMKVGQGTVAVEHNVFVVEDE